MPGHLCKFIEKVRRKYVCPLCRLPMRDPVQITTCDHHFCDTCLQEYLSEGIFECPEDRLPLDYAKIYPDDDMADEIFGMTVRCSYYKDGCKWLDLLCELQTHLESCKFHKVQCTNDCQAVVARRHMQHHLDNECPKRRLVCESCRVEISGRNAETHKRVCTYEKVSCANNCGVKLQRRYMSNHNLNECPKRSIECKYCKKDYLFDNLQNHLHDCPKYPVTCPNRCDPERMARGDLETHLRDHCPSASIYCPFKEHGCRHKCPRFTLDQHLEEDTKKHLGLMCEVTKRQQEEINSLKTQLESLTCYTDGTLVWKIQDMASKVSRAKKEEHMELQSPCFFTSKHGYKLKLTLFPNGNGSGEGTHISLYLKILPGEYDELLQWPFVLPVEFCLVDQTDDSKRRKHIKESFTADPSWKNFHRPSKDIETLGYGYPTFVSHEELKSVKYIKDDCMFIKVTVDTSKVIHLI
ncbi:TNF receptor-associated factor 4-like [Ptychodera flava]|uniref:TNF receptor-associated factor 4-like n=1 Tax=Ptychodera flava TaxID=63121 RepID=UPI00396A4D1F